MSIVVRPIEANLTHETELIESMDPFVKIYFGGQEFRTSVCKNGGKNPSWNDVFTFNPAGDSNLRIEVWDSDLLNDDLIGEGRFNLMQVYNMPSMRSDNQFIDLFYKGKIAGRILISFELQGMQGFWGQPQMGSFGSNCNTGGFNYGCGGQGGVQGGHGGGQGGLGNPMGGQGQGMSGPYHNRW